MLKPCEIERTHEHTKQAFIDSQQDRKENNFLAAEN
jgi:hypothetical protein